MAIKSVQAIVNGVTTTLTYDSASKTYKATLTAPAKSSYNQSGHYYGVQIIAKDEAGNTTTVNQSDATLGSKLRLTVKEKTAPVITISSPTASQLLTSNQPTISFTVTDDDSGVNPDTIKLLIDGSEISGITKTKTTSAFAVACKLSRKILNESRSRFALLSNSTFWFSKNSVNTSYKSVPFSNAAMIALTAVLMRLASYAPKNDSSYTVYWVTSFTE
jgi:hypothetical protein